MLNVLEFYFHRCGVFLIFLSSVLSSPCVRWLPTHNHVMFLLKKSAGCYPILRKVTFSTNITEESAGTIEGDVAHSVIVETEQKKNHSLRLQLSACDAFATVQRQCDVGCHRQGFISVHSS